MDETGFIPLTAPTLALRDRLTAAGLDSHVVDLDITGYTVVPSVLDAAEVAALASALRALADAHDPSAAASEYRDRSIEVPLLLARDFALFRPLIARPRLADLIGCLLGDHAVVSSVTGYVKGEGGPALTVHADAAYIPDPYPSYSQLANVNFCLTDYAADAGGLSVVPGSHRWAHRPMGTSGAELAVPVVARAGDAIVFTGSTWHGAGRRTAPGTRLMISTLYGRAYLRPQEDYTRALDPATLDDDERRLLGFDLPTGWSTTDEFRTVEDRRRSRAGEYYVMRNPDG